MQENCLQCQTQVLSNYLKKGSFFTVSSTSLFYKFHQGKNLLKCRNERNLFTVSNTSFVQFFKKGSFFTVSNTCLLYIFINQRIFYSARMQENSLQCQTQVSFTISLIIGPLYSVKHKFSSTI
jgi:hypothetical protein